MHDGKKVSELQVFSKHVEQHKWSDRVLDGFSHGKGGYAERCGNGTAGMTVEHHCKPGSSIYGHMARRPLGTKEIHKNMCIF